MKLKKRKNETLLEDIVPRVRVGKILGPPHNEPLTQGEKKMVNKERMAIMNQHPKGWMVSGQERVFCWVPVP
jgi:hypothetical protein